MSTNPSHDDRPTDTMLEHRCSPHPSPRASGERTALLQLERANGMLHERAPDAPVDFAIRLFAGAAAEDLLRYQPQELAELAAATWRFLAERAPRTAKIRVSNPDDGPRLENVSVVELINDDMPFLVDSVMGELNHRGLEAYLLVHPVFRVARDAAGKLTRFGNGIEAAPLRESIIQVHVDRIDDDAARSALAEALAGVVSDVRLAVQDWRSMLDRVGGIIDALKTDPPPLPEDDVAETIAFLEWLKDNNFTFLGVREYRLEADGAALAAHSELDARRAARQPGRAGHRRQRPDRNVAAGEGGLRGAPADADHQHQRALAGAPAGADGHDRNQALPRRPAVGRSTDRRSVHLDRLYPLDPQHPVSPPQGRRRSRAGRVYAGQPFRQDARERARYLSPRRAVPDRRGHARPFRAHHPAAQ